MITLLLNNLLRPQDSRFGIKHNIEYRSQFVISWYFNINVYENFGH